MVSYDAQRCGVKDLLGISDARMFASLLHNTGKQIDFVVAVHALQNSRHTLKTHTRIHAGLRQRIETAIGISIELGEYQILELNEAIPILVRRTRRATGDRRPVVVKQFGTGATGTGIPHGPKILF